MTVGCWHCGAQTHSGPATRIRRWTTTLRGEFQPPLADYLVGIQIDPTTPKIYESRTCVETLSKFVRNSDFPVEITPKILKCSQKGIKLIIFELGSSCSNGQSLTLSNAGYDSGCYGDQGC